MPARRLPRPPLPTQCEEARSCLSGTQGQPGPSAHSLQLSGVSARPLLAAVPRPGSSPITAPGQPSRDPEDRGLGLCVAPLPQMAWLSSWFREATCRSADCLATVPLARHLGAGSPIAIRSEGMRRDPPSAAGWGCWAWAGESHRGASRAGLAPSSPPTCSQESAGLPLL